MSTISYVEPVTMCTMWKNVANSYQKIIIWLMGAEMWKNVVLPSNHLYFSNETTLFHIDLADSPKRLQMLEKYFIPLIITGDFFIWCELMWLNSSCHPRARFSKFDSHILSQRCIEFLQDCIYAPSSLGFTIQLISLTICWPSAIDNTTYCSLT